MKLERLYLLLHCLLLLIPISVWGQGKKDDIMETFRKYSYECYLTEVSEKEGFRNCQNVYQKYMADAKDEELIEWKENLTKKIVANPDDVQKWNTSGCSSFDPKRIAAFRNSEPDSCLAIGEMYEEYQKPADAKKAFVKACGHQYLNSYLATVKTDSVEAQRILSAYGCVTPLEAKEHNIKDVPICSNHRLLGCIRLGAILKAEDKEKEAIVLFNRACGGGLDDGCEKLRQNNQESTTLLYASLFLIALATFIAFKMFFDDTSQYKASEQLEEVKESPKDEIAKHGAILKYSRPFFKRYLSPVVASMKSKKAFKEKYRRPLASAGLTEIMTPEDFMAFKLFLIVGFPIVFLGARTFIEADWPLSSIPFIALFGFFYPDLWINGKKQLRQKEVIGNMPFAVDMLALSVEAGLDFVAAMQKVVDKAKPSALVEEFSIMIKEIKIGANRAEALRNMSWRIDLIQITSFTATLIAADSVGASIGPILKSLSKEIRQKKSSEVEKAGAQAATKILFPMLFLITPAVLIVVAAPLVIEAIFGS
jgi:tight adherence protein C